MISIFASKAFEELPPGLQEIAERRARALAGDPPLNDDGHSPWPMLKNAMLIIGFGTACFTGGYNAKEITLLSDRFAAQSVQNEKDHSTFAKRDVVDEQFRALSDTVRTMQRQLDRIEEKVERRK